MFTSLFATPSDLIVAVLTLALRLTLGLVILPHGTGGGAWSLDALIAAAL